MSARIPGSETIAFTPGHSSNVPSLIRPEDIRVVDLTADVASRDDLPLGWRLDMEIYRRRPTIGAILAGSPEAALCRAIADRRIRALSHSQSHVVHQGIARVSPPRMPVNPVDTARIADAMGDNMVLQIVGVAAVACDSSILAALRRCHDLETLARLTNAADSFGSDVREVTPEESAAVVAQRPVEAVPSRDPRRYYQSLDPGPDGPSAGLTRFGQDLKADVALACRILASRESLVAYFEHVSHRIPGDPDRFLMSPAKHFPRMTAGDIGVVGTSGDCEWLEGPYPPAPFRWYHRDLLAARPDINAIVHTHELYGRAAVLAGRRLQPIHRVGALLDDSPLATFETPTLGFLPEHRAEAIRLAESTDTVHLLSHGTDYLAPTIEEAVVRAIQREELARLTASVAAMSDLRTIAPLSDGVINDLKVYGPSYSDWWNYYVSTAPPTGSAGLNRRA